MPTEILEFGQPEDGQYWIDGTAGGGGHSRLILQRLGDSGRLLALDRDAQAVERLQECLDRPAIPFHSSYEMIPELVKELEWTGVHGVLLDLGLSSDQLADQQRGFSFQTGGELDMRFDQSSGRPIWQWLARIDEKTLANSIFQFGEERFSRRIARRIVEQRRKSQIRTVDQLREIVYSCVPRQKPKRNQYGRSKGVIDPATRTFQALRIVANDELGALQRTLARLPEVLLPGGRLLVISFHSLEDRLVKHALRDDERWEVVTRKPLQASDEEVASNPRARSAKLRVARRL